MANFTISLVTEELPTVTTDPFRFFIDRAELFKDLRFELKGKPARDVLGKQERLRSEWVIYRNHRYVGTMSSESWRPIL